MDRMLFVNLPVADLEASRRFYTGLGFGVNEMFSDDRCACVVVSDAIFVMLLDRDRFADFTDRPTADPTASTGVVNCLSADSRDEVDALVASAEAHGGRSGRTFADGPMYGRSFDDPDGHVWEVLHMELAGVP